MTIRPIIFSAPMVRALLDGRKTMTRRIIKPKRRLSLFDGTWTDAYVLDDRNARWRAEEIRYAPGDLLWVRESFCPIDNSEFGESNYVDYRATPEDGDPSMPGGWHNAPDHPDALKWKPSIHMPRWASRLTLCVTDVKVERLNEITEADAIAEGVEAVDAERYDHDWAICPSCGGTGLHGALASNLGYMEVDCRDCDTHKKRFRHLWNRIHGPDAWDEDPWVAAIRFTVHHCNVDAMTHEVAA